MSDILYFYMLAFLMLISASGIIFAPRMYLSVLSLLSFILFSSLLYLALNAGYIALFQFILSGLCIFIYIFLLLKKIGRLNLALKLVKPLKIAFAATAVSLFGIFSCLFFKEEFTNSLFDIFNSVIEKSSDIIHFSDHIFPLHLMILLLFVSAVVIRVFLLSSNNTEQNEDETKCLKEQE